MNTRIKTLQINVKKNKKNVRIKIQKDKLIQNNVLVGNK